MESLEVRLAFCGHRHHNSRHDEMLTQSGYLSCSHEQANRLAHNNISEKPDKFFLGAYLINKSMWVEVSLEEMHSLNQPFLQTDKKYGNDLLLNSKYILKMQFLSN